MSDRDSWQSVASTMPSGHRNGMPEWKPYVRDPRIRARELQVEAVRARIRDEIDGGEANV